MSENLNCGIRDFTKYDSMKTEELEEILRLDSEAPEGQESDTEELLYIMEVLANRKKMNHTGKTAQQAWEAFQQDYLPEVEESLEYTRKKQSKSPRYRLHRFVAAAAVIALLICIPPAAGAFDWADIWNAVAKWAKETFSFVSPDDTRCSEPSPNNCDTYSSLQEALAETNNKADIVPTSLPERYKLERIVIDESPIQRTYVAFYLNGDVSMKISVQVHLDSDPEKAEITGELLETYEVSGVKYYIISNHEQLRAAWITGSYECYISGELTMEELKLMIDSIGKG